MLDQRNSEANHIIFLFSSFITFNTLTPIHSLTNAPWPSSMPNCRTIGSCFNCTGRLCVAIARHSVECHEEVERAGQA